MAIEIKSLMVKLQKTGAMSMCSAQEEDHREGCSVDECSERGYTEGWCDGEGCQ